MAEPELIDTLTARPDGDDRFVAVGPASWGDRVFGGVLLAQVMSAAMQTGPDGTRPHSLHAHFLRPVGAGDRLELTVDRVRDGRSFAIRQVRGTVDGKPTILGTVSFCGADAAVDEGGADVYQLRPDPTLPKPDELEPNGFTEDAFAFREIGATEPAVDGTRQSTRRTWLRPLVDGIDHAVLAAFASDMTGTSFRPHGLDYWGAHTDASLDHALWLHRPPRFDDWSLYDLACVVNTEARSTVRGTFWAIDGELWGSMGQELLIRPLPNPQPVPWQGGL